MSNQLKSGLFTAIIMLLVALVLLAFGYDPPDPPIPEEGVEVNVGDSDYGLGEAPEPASDASSFTPPAAQNQVATQQTESSLAMPSTPNRGNITNPSAQEQPIVENKEPEINRNAIFPGKRNRTSPSGAGSEGVTSGSGNQGSPNGNPNSNNYNGNGGSGTGSYSLAGRTAVSLPKPDYNSNVQGTVVIAIWVDQQGRVTRAEYQPKGSNTSNGDLVSRAKAAAMKARFNASSDALAEQKGTITYIFKI